MPQSEFFQLLSQAYPDQPLIGLVAPYPEIPQNVSRALANFADGWNSWDDPNKVDLSRAQAIFPLLDNTASFDELTTIKILVSPLIPEITRAFQAVVEDAKQWLEIKGSENAPLVANSLKNDRMRIEELGEVSEADIEQYILGAAVCNKVQWMDVCLRGLLNAEYGDKRVEAVRGILPATAAYTLAGGIFQFENVVRNVRRWNENGDRRSLSLAARDAGYFATSLEKVWSTLKQPCPFDVAKIIENVVGNLSSTPSVQP